MTTGAPKGNNVMDHIVKGVPIQVLAKIKPNNGFQKEDLTIHDNRIGLIDANNRVREEYEVSQAFNDESSTDIFNAIFP